MSKYTPGPWAINTAGSAKAGQPFKVTEIYVYAPDTQDDVAICADVIDPVTQAPSEANARLIAAAPDLLEILIDFASSPYIAAHHPKRLAKALAAIAKAEGEQP